MPAGLAQQRATLPFGILHHLLLQEEREFQQRLLALAGIGPAPGGGGGAGAEGGEGGEEEEYLSEDEVDPDDLSYEEVGRAACMGQCCMSAAKLAAVPGQGAATQRGVRRAGRWA